MNKRSVAAAALALSACSFSTYHEKLMTNQELIGADCQQLAAEELRVADNARHASETATNGAITGAFLSVLSAYHQTDDVGKNSTNLATQHEQQAKELEGRRQMISTLRMRKGC